MAGPVPRRQPAAPPPDHTDYPTLAGLEAAWPAVHADLLAFVDRQTPVALAGPLSYRNTKGDPFSLPLGQALLNVADHATYHRGQLNSLAKRAGGTPGPIMRFTWAAVVADDERRTTNDER